MGQRLQHGTGSLDITNYELKSENCSGETKKQHETTMLRTATATQLNLDDWARQKRLRRQNLEPNDYA